MFNLSDMQNKPHRFAIGLMSGTSCDGIDAVLVRLRGTGTELAMKFLEHHHYPYTPDFRLRLLNEHLTAKELCLLNFELGEHLASAAKPLIESAREQQMEVDFIASHGQTVAHFPPKTNAQIGTLQIGEPAIIAERCGVTVVSDFRPRDMAVGGQGAPLVPYADWLLFRKEERTVACLNIGGIANFTVVPPAFEDILAFDSGPGNMAIDGAMMLLSGGAKEYDQNGACAAQGVVIDEFLTYLLAHKFFRELPPKSTGRDEFGHEPYLRDALNARRDHRTEDLIATITEAAALSMADAYKRFIAPAYTISHLIVAGGGAKNKFLIKRLQKHLHPLRICSSEQYGIPFPAREAIAFAILGNETICGTPSNVPKATGAERAVVLGKITPA